MSRASDRADAKEAAEQAEQDAQRHVVTRQERAAIDETVAEDNAQGGLSRDEGDRAWSSFEPAKAPTEPAPQQSGAIRVGLGDQVPIEPGKSYIPFIHGLEVGAPIPYDGDTGTFWNRFGNACAPLVARIHERTGKGEREVMVDGHAVMASVVERVLSIRE